MNSHRRYAAIVLAGGAGRRLGGAGKPGLAVGGRPMVDWVLAAVAEAQQVVVVGPEVGGGPVPALRHGMGEVSEVWVAVLAADLPFLRGEHVQTLLAAAAGGDGAVLADDEGRPQWLAGCWSAGRLRPALAGYAGDSLRGLLAPLRPALVRIPGEPEPWRDCDTPEALAWARERYS